MNPKALLITRPFYENPTNYLYHWSEPLIALAKQKNFKVVDLQGRKATRKDLEGRLKKVGLDLLVFNGHGDGKNIFGQDDEPIIVKGENDQLLSGKIVYTRSCLSARELGNSAIKRGSRAFIGYAEDFIFMVDRSYTTRPLQDKTAELFLEPSNNTVRSLLKGNTAAQANESGKNSFLRNILKLLTSEVRKEDSDTVRYLIWDMKHQVCLGDKDARL